jgi:hypothetical protein
MDNQDYQTLTQRVTRLSSELESIKNELASLKDGDIQPQRHYTKEEVESFRKGREELIYSYRRFLQAMKNGMDADLIRKYKKWYLDEIGRRFTGDYIDSTKSRFLAEFEFAYNASPRIIVVDNYTIPIDGNTMGGRELVDILRKANPSIPDDEIRTVAEHYYARVHADNVPAMMNMVEKALSGTPTSTANTDTPWDDDGGMLVK